MGRVVSGDGDATFCATEVAGMRRKTASDDWPTHSHKEIASVGLL